MNFERPILKIKTSRTDNLLDLISFTLLILTWAFAIVQYSSLPGTIPIHFDFKGNVDDYGNKATIFLLPAIISIVIIGMTILNKHPHIFNYPQNITAGNALVAYTKATRLIRVIKLVITVFALVLTYDIIRSAKTTHSTLSWWLIPIFMLSMILPVVISIYSFLKDRKPKQPC